MVGRCEHDAVLAGVEEIIHPDHSALIVVDVQNDFAHEDGFLAKSIGQDMTHVQRALPNINRAIESARDAGVRVIYLKEVISESSLLPNFVTLFGEFGDTAVREGTWGAELVEGLLQPRDGESVICKPCYDGFQDSALNVTLRSLGIRTCIYCGGATNVCVEATARHGFVNGYYTVLLEDACGAASTQEHESTLSTFRVFYGPVLQVDDANAVWVDASAELSS